MPQSNESKLSAAKAVAAHADKAQQSMGGPLQKAAAIARPAAKQDVPKSAHSEVDDIAAGLKWKREQANTVRQSYSQPTPSNDKQPPSFKEGGTVAKTGIYKLHEGEKVTPVEDKAPKSSKPVPDEKLGHYKAVAGLHNGELHKWAGVDPNLSIPEAKKLEAAGDDDDHVSNMGRLSLHKEHFRKGTEKLEK